MSDDFFAMLDAEIATITKASKLRADREAAKKRANNMRASPEIRAAAKATFKALDAELSAQEWTSTKTIALFHEQSCDGCGSVHYTFLQFMEVQSLIRKPSTERSYRVAKPDPKLPRETLVQPMLTHMCASCCEDHGFAVPTAKRLRSRQEAVVPSFTYEQEDINAEA